MKIIANHPPNEMYETGEEIDCHCARCGSWMLCWIDADFADEYSDHDRGDARNIHGFWYRCVSSPDSCQANPLPGREHIQRGQVEWFTCGQQP